MEGDEHPARVLLRDSRQRVIDALSDAFAKDEIGLEEFENRVDRAYACKTTEELAALLRDLTPVEVRDAGARAVVVVESRSPEVVAAGSSIVVARPERNRGIVAIFGNVERRGSFALRNGMHVSAVFGNVEIDLRNVTLPNGVTEIFVRAVLGNVEITVPPTLAVECEGSGLLGSFSALNRLPVEGTGREPVLRVIGSAVLGNVEIRTRPRNEPHPRRLPQ